MDAGGPGALRRGDRMQMLRTIDYSSFASWEQKLQSHIRGCGSIEEVAQRASQHVYDSFRESVVLARLYATIPYKKLPAENRRFVASVVKQHGASAALVEETPVLSLLGTYGDKPEWNNRHTSKGHVGIPLISADFIELIPM